MFKGKVIVEGTTIAEVVELMEIAPALMRKNLVTRIVPRLQRAVDTLSTEPGPPKYPIRWKSERQRRAFFATNGFGRGIGAKRTHKLSKGWRWTFKDVRYGGEITIENNEPSARFVQGPDAQPFHLDTGWVQPEPIIAQLDIAIDDDLTTAWAITGDQIIAGRRR